jgi:hypothetical protein
MSYAPEYILAHRISSAAYFGTGLSGVDSSSETYPRYPAFDKRRIYGLAWTAAGKELIFSSNRRGQQMLWRINVSAGAPSVRLAGITQDAQAPG